MIWQLTGLLERPEVARLGWTLVHFGWQGVVLGGMAVLAKAGLRAAGPRWRSAAAVTLLVATLACPVVTFCLLPSADRVRLDWPELREPRGAVLAERMVREPEMIGHPLATAGGKAADVPVPVPASTDGPSSEVRAAAAGPLLGSGEASTASGTWLSCTVLLWAAGVLVMAFRQVGGWWMTLGWRKPRTTVPDDWPRRFDDLCRRMGVGTAVRLVASAGGAGPAVVGIFRPVVVVPWSLLTGFAPAHIEAILAHELAHLKRRDHWVALLLATAELLLFYHPAVWFIGRWVREEREFAADDLAADVHQDRLGYARALAALAACDEGLPAPGIAARGASLPDRLRRVLAPGHSNRNLPGVMLFVGLLAAGGTALVLPLSGQQSEPAAAGGAVITVNAGDSLQAAIDRAPVGSTIQIGEGTFVENIVVRKALTLAGGGPSKTRLQQKSPEGGAPALLIEGARVELRAIHLMPVPSGNPEAMGPGAVVSATKATALIVDCVIEGPGQNGVILAESSADISRTLVAGMWGTGVTIGQGCRNVRIAESDIRNCHHSGIRIGRAEGVKIESCLISGAAWHGIRYDHCSPEIVGCVIFQNARFGIYASGTTKATIRGNVFLKNEMAGISCWYANEDTVEGNTFADNLREGVMVLGGSSPAVRRNIITGSPVALVTGKIGGDTSSVEPAPKLESNLVWNCGEDWSHLGKNQPLPETAVSLREDPGFQDTGAKDFSLIADSPARKAGIGAARMIPLASRWPLTQAEIAIIPDGESRDYQLWKKPGHRAEAQKKAAEAALAQVRTDAEALVQEALQIDSVERRDAAIEAMRRAIASEDEKEALTGLTALSRSCAAEFDKAPFRPLVRRWLMTSGTAHRQAALSALFGLGAEAGDLEGLYALAENTETPDRKSLVSWLLWLGKNDLTGRAGAVVVDLLRSESEAERRDVLNAIWGGSFSPELEKRVLELSGPSGAPAHYDTVYYALSPQANKSAASVERLLEIMGGLGDSHRAHWGLGQGVSAEVAPVVCRGVIALFGKSTDPELRHRCLTLLGTYASREEGAFLDTLLAKPALTRAMRKDIEEAKRLIDGREGRYGSTLPKRE